MTTVAIATPLAGGELIGGIALTLSVQTLYNYGFRAGIQNDKHRQILLNMLCFTCVCSSITSLGYNATETFWQANDAALLIVFTCIQVGVITTVARAAKRKFLINTSSSSLSMRW